MKIAILNYIFSILYSIYCTILVILYNEIYLSKSSCVATIIFY